MRRARGGGGGGGSGNSSSGDELHVPKKKICFLTTSFGACDADSVQFSGCFRDFRDFCHLRTLLLLYLFLIALSAGMLASCEAPVTCVSFDFGLSFFRSFESVDREREGCCGW
ncbi:unnamed protein product [Sphagnum balticum]